MTSTPDFNELEKKFSKEIQAAHSSEKIEALRLEVLGRKGVLNSLMEALKNAPASEKQKIGREVNAFKEKIQEAFSKKKADLENKDLEESLKKDRQDLTLPARAVPLGKAHPITQVMEEVVEIFTGMGFAVAQGPEIESDENNFGALNIPADHPARDMHDTFYVESQAGAGLLLRTHTSPVQIQVMRGQKPPVRIIAPGKVYRHEAIDATHSSVFHQVEGLVVDQDISLADLKGTLELFSQRLFGEAVRTRFRPSYFPFVEPGMEVDISCTICEGGEKVRGGNCPVCKGTGWLEMLGAGMVHPNVFKAVGYDPEAVTGFAFGMGIERIAMVRYGISDMRLFYENHLDFLSQF